MAMGDPNWVSLLPGPPAQSAREVGNAGALAGYQLGQAAATRGALQGIDVNDQASINRGIGALTRAGAIEAANGILNLNSTRIMQQTKLPIYQAVGRQALEQITGAQPAQPAQPPAVADMTPDQHAHTLATLDAMDAIEQKISSLPYAQRRAAMEAEAPTLHERGIDPSVISGFDPTDENIAKTLADHAALRAQIAAHAAPADPSIPPTRAIADANLSNPIYSNPIAVGVLKEMGFDPSDTLNRDVTLTGPMRAKEAEAQFAGPITAATTAATNAVNTNPATAPAPFQGGVRGTLPNGQPGFVAQPGATQGQAAVAGATALGTDAGSHGGRVLFDVSGAPVVQPVQGAAGTAAGYQGAVSGATAGATAAATAPYEMVPGITDPVTGAPLYRSRADFAHGNVPSSGASPQVAAINEESAKQLVADRQTSGQLQTQLVPLRTAYDLIHSGQVRLGPGSETWNRVQSFVTNTLHLDQSAVANYDEAHKYLVQIANQRATQFGQGTNEKLAVAASGSPNVNMSSLGAADVLRVNIALARADAAKAAAYGNAPPEGYSTFASNYGRTTDPRAFMLDMLTPAERSSLFANVKKSGPAAQAAFANGLIAAKAANYFDPAKLPR